MGVEPETRAFFILIANSLALMLIWMILNVLFGIYLGYAFFETAPGWKNYLYYSLSLIAFIFVLIRLVKKWKQHLG
jgi:bacteriorhodopsin